MDCLQDLEQLVSDMLGFARGAGGPDTEVALREIIDAVETAARPLLRHGQALIIDHAIPDLHLTRQPRVAQRCPAAGQQRTAGGRAAAPA